MDFNNWNKERQKLKEEIFMELREQKDRKRHQNISGTMVINPQSFIENEFVDFNPVFFETAFKTAPEISFGQALHEPGKDFLLSLVIKEWIWEAGVLEGFILRARREMTPKEGQYKHIVTWHATGTASLYRRERVTDAWTLAYSPNPAAMIIDNSKEFRTDI